MVYSPLGTYRPCPHKSQPYWPQEGNARLAQGRDRGVKAAAWAEVAKLAWTYLDLIYVVISFIIRLIL